MFVGASVTTVENKLNLLFGAVDWSHSTVTKREWITQLVQLMSCAGLELAETMYVLYKMLMVKQQRCSATNSWAHLNITHYSLPQGHAVCLEGG